MWGPDLIRKSGRVWCKSTWAGGLWPRDGRAVVALLLFYLFVYFYSFLCYYLFGFYQLGSGVGSIRWFNVC